MQKLSYSTNSVPGGTETSKDRPVFRAKDPISSLTHFIGFLMAIVATPLLLIHGAFGGAPLRALISMGVFMLSMILLYGASASYHAFNLDEVRNHRLKCLDHMSIFVLIAGSYTPVCLIAIPGKARFGLWPHWECCSNSSG